MLRALERSIAQVTRQRSTAARRRAALETLVVAGELESALADMADPLERVVGEATYALARVMVGENVDLSICAEGLAHARAPRSLAIRPHAGFAYDALHPDAYAAASKAIDARRVVVLGTADAGATLSAVTAAALAARGAATERMTLRRGHEHGVASQLHAALRRTSASHAAIVVVDSAPSTALIETADAIVAAGIPRERVYCIVSRSIGAPQSLRTLVARSSSFAPVRTDTARDVSGGAWRKLHFGCERDWPAVNGNTERSKLLSGGRLYKFEGLGSNGLGARHRASALAAEGIALDPREEGDGWVSYAWDGIPLTLADLDTELLEHMARYLARRPTLCPLVSAETDLEPIVAHDMAALLGEVSPPLPLDVVRIATTDGQLMPHEWIRLEDGSIRKTDAITHGDDRFLPGPTDIAYDLAGAIVEWRMDRQTRQHFLTAYRRASGDDASTRIDAWIIAYLTIRASMIVHALEDAPPTEAERLGADLERYRAELARSYQRSALSSQP